MLDIEDIIGGVPAIDQRKQSLYDKMPQLFLPGQSGNPNGRPVGVKNEATIIAEFGQDTLDKLDKMPHKDLVKLFKQTAGAAGWVKLGLLSQDDIKAATRLRLANIALHNKNDETSLRAISQMLDRLEGKPVGTSPTVQIGTTGDLNVMIRLVDAAGKVETIQGN